MTNSVKELESINQKLKKQLQDLKQEALQNELLLRQTQTRQLELLTSESLPDLLRMLLSRLRDVYNLQAVTLVYEDKDESLAELLERHHLSLEDYTNLRTVTDARKFSKQLKDINTPYLGEFNSALKEFFFTPKTKEIGDKIYFPLEQLRSVAILPLARHAKKIGYLSFGSSDAQRFSQELGTEFLQQLATIISFCLENVINRERLVLTGLTDVLTGWPNRRYLQQRLQEELARMQRKMTPISCIIFDIDKFKNINDSYGHPVGDEVLRSISSRLRKTLRYGDIAARYGGEEFIIALPDVKLAEAVQFAERIREIVEEHPVKIANDQSVKVTISLGVACVIPEWSEKSMTYAMGELIAEADRHLYSAKTKGRNQVAF